MGTTSLEIVEDRGEACDEIKEHDVRNLLDPRKGENRFSLHFAYFNRRGSDADLVCRRQDGSIMIIYHFPPLSLNRLVREAINGYRLRCLEFPDPERPFTRLDPATMPWPASANTFGMRR